MAGKTLANAPKKREREAEVSVEGAVEPSVCKKARQRVSADQRSTEHNTQIQYDIFHPQFLADHMSRQTARFAADLSQIELEELRIPIKPIIDTTNWPHARQVTEIAEFLTYYSPSTEQNVLLPAVSSSHGTPHTLVISMSGIRAADLTRALRVLQTEDSTVAKLFAKHIKLKDAIESARKTRMGIGVGTPGRIIDLLNTKALKTDNLRRIIVDWSHTDLKMRNIIDMKDTQNPLIELLSRDEMRERYASGDNPLKLLFF